MGGVPRAVVSCRKARLPLGGYHLAHALGNRSRLTVAERFTQKLIPSLHSNPG